MCHSDSPSRKDLLPRCKECVWLTDPVQLFVVSQSTSAALNTRSHSSQCVVVVARHWGDGSQGHAFLRTLPANDRTRQGYRGLLSRGIFALGLPIRPQGFVRSAQSCFLPFFSTGISRNKSLYSKLCLSFCFQKKPTCNRHWCVRWDLKLRKGHAGLAHRTSGGDREERTAHSVTVIARNKRMQFRIYRMPTMCQKLCKCYHSAYRNFFFK